MVKRIPETRQTSLTLDVEPAYGPLRRPSPTPFNEPNPDEIFFGDKPLARGLEADGYGWIVEMARFLRQVDLSSLTASYSGHAGQPPLHPRLLLGLVLFGFMEGMSSLRDLEKLARRDLAAMYLTGGLKPDHSTLGRFLVRHSDALTNQFFTELTGQLLKWLGKKKPGAAAMDGTVIEAVASRFSLAKAEAVKQAAAEARAAANHAPDDEKLQKAAAGAEVAADVAKARQEARKAVRLKGDPSISRTEPEAAYQPLKNGAYRPAYRPSVIATEDRMVVGVDVHPTNELKSVAPMLEQYKSIMGAPPTTLMADAGYHAAWLLQEFVASDINALIPTGGESSPDLKEQRTTTFAKSQFVYDPSRDAYRCPNNKLLILAATVEGNSPYRRYRCDECVDCPVRSKCTKTTSRTIDRRPDDDVREAMAQVLAHPHARRQYSQRKAMVEPVFSVLGSNQGVRRFRRRGLRGACLEFVVHCLAHNVRTAFRVAARAAEAALRRFVAIFSAWRVAAICIVLTSPHRQVAV